MGQKTAGTGERQSYPEDRFDRVPRHGRVGAHRVTAKPRYIWQYVIAGLLGFAVLTGAGILVVHAIGGTGNLSTLDTASQAVKPQAVQPELDPNATVAVINGSERANLAAALDTIITDESWGQILFSGSAASKDVQISAVFYSAEEDAEAAAGLAAKLGGLSTYTTQDYDEYDAQLIVLLGADYAGPGIPEAEALTVDGATSNEAETDAESDADSEPTAEAEGTAEVEGAAEIDGVAEVEGGVVPEGTVEVDGNAGVDALVETPVEAPVDAPADVAAQAPATETVQ